MQRKIGTANLKSAEKNGGERVASSNEKKSMKT